MPTSFTYTEFTHTFADDNGNPSVGSVTFTLTDTMTNGADSITKGTAFDSILVAGVLDQPSIASNIDPGTVPTIPQAKWRVDIRIEDTVDTYFITVPVGGPFIGSEEAPAVVLDLFSLFPSEEQVS